MRKFKCYDCQHKFELPHGEGGRGIELVCPKCGSENVHRTWEDSLQDVIQWGGRGRHAEGFGWGRGAGRWGQRRGRSYRGWRVSSIEPQKEADIKDGERS